MTILLLAVLLAQNPRPPVLVELFTSEGCSSCPPADALLEQLDNPADTIVLSEHVDYWDQAGWRDRFSSPVFTKRQQTYASRFHLDSVYTPQMVVDGTTEVLGSDKAAALKAIQQVNRAQTLDIHLTRLPTGLIELKVDPLPSSMKGERTVYVAIADNHDTTEVRAGENKGRTLHHVAVVRSLTAVGKVNATNGFTKDLPAAQRLVALVQEPNQGRVLGTAVLIP